MSLWPVETIRSNLELIASAKKHEGFGVLDDYSFIYLARFELNTENLPTLLTLSLSAMTLFFKTCR